ncbi:transcription termination factor NusA [Pedosphaera parvula]|uniref:Transcription termination/antitermination protein NusA n=1 Tax=Pedosphaera parvula (strain Ellin514) TaxID=320771 RepID=B9XFC0_PEDPL|nr:transcription termination factor NusA [Pedosphaera parvula]EEF61284.1 NusA antitermination factor [Pedosphaera parvula Ellin514]
MNADFLTVLEFWEREKGISRQVLISAVEESLLSAAKKAVGPARELRCIIDPKSGDIKAFAKLIVSEKVVSKHDHISLPDAKKIKPDAQLGEEVEVEVTPAGFGRIASQYAKQSLMQHIRRAEKQLIFTEFKDRVGDIISGVVRRFDRSDVSVDLGKYEALLPNRERVPTEEYQIGERIRCYVKAVENGPHGPEIILSRADPRFVIKLFQLEVSEINDGTIEIKGIAREPGFRTKLAVYTRDEKVDPVGACVGLRGQRVKNIVRELNNEKVDIIRWEPNIKGFLTNALAPAQLKTFEVDEANKRVKIVVGEDQLSLAIGKRGQNARLSSKLTGWQVDIEPEVVHRMGFEEKVAEAVKTLAAIPGITQEQADTLVHQGLTRLEDLLQADISDLSGIPQIGDQAAAILEAAKAEAARHRLKLGEDSAG